MSKEVQSVLLVLLGGAVLRISLGETYLRYVKEWMQPFLIASGAVLLLLGLLSAWYDALGRRTPEVSDPAADHADHQVDGPAGDHGHDHGHGPRVAWALLLPVLAIFLVAPPALGSYAASRDDNTVAAPTGDSSFPALPAGDPVELAVLDYATRAVWDEGRTLAGRTVVLTGFATPDGDGGWQLARIALACCAADGRATKVQVDGAPAPAADQWVRLTGRWVAGGGTMSDDAVPVVEALEVELIEAPRNPYE